MARARVTPVRLYLSERGQIELTRAVLVVLDQQARDGIDADGRPFPPGVTKKIDLHDTGRLFRDVQVYTTRLQWQAPYASVVQRLYRFAGVAPQYKAQLEAMVRGTIAREVRSAD